MFVSVSDEVILTVIINHLKSTLTLGFLAGLKEYIFRKFPQ